MWVMKLKVNGEKMFLGRMAIKHKVSMTGYSLSYWKQGNFIYLIQLGLMFGSEKRKKQLIKDMKKQKEFVEVEINNDFAILVTKQPLFMEPVFNPKVLHTTPAIVNYKEKKHTWTLASFDKKLLTNVFEFAKEYLDAEMLKFKQEKISNISIVRVLPKLTKRQKMALEIAINNGYYDYPKKIKLEQLAKIMKISYSTYQEHLKKAEGSIIPAVYREL